MSFISSSCRNFFWLVRKAFLSVFIFSFFPPAFAIADLTTPLAVSNQSPLIQIYGLPGMGRSLLLAAGELETQVAIDVANNFNRERDRDESLLLDGESYRYSLRLSYGVSDRLELGIHVPYVNHQGGSLDGFIDDWHSFFWLPTSGRENVPKDQLNYLYSKNNTEFLNLQEEVDGIGDVRLCAAWQLSDGAEPDATAIALHGSLKLPTGDSDKLTGSGSTDFALWLSAGRQRTVPWGDLGLMTSLGLMVMDDGDVLEDQQRNIVGFGGVGFALQPWKRVRLQVQVDFHSSFYENSNMAGVDSASAQLAMGGTIILNPGNEIEMAVVEDIIVDTAPDVVFHLAWTKRF